MEISLEKEEAMEVGVLLLLLTLLSAVVFSGWLEISAKNYPIAFICGPIVIWTAFLSLNANCHGYFHSVQ